MRKKNGESRLKTKKKWEIRREREKNGETRRETKKMERHDMR